MRYLTLLGFVAVVFATSGWTRPPAVDGTMTRVAMIEASFGKAPENPGGSHSLQMVFLVTRKAGSTGELTLGMRGQRATSVAGQNYLELTQAKLGRALPPFTNVYDAPKYFADHPKLQPEGPVPDNASVVTVMIIGIEADADSEWQTKLSVGYNRKVEETAFTFKPMQRPPTEVPWALPPPQAK